MAQQSQPINAANIPSGRLTTPLVDVRLLGFLAQARGTVRVLLAHCLPVGQVLRSVTHHNQRTDLGSIDGHVCVYSCSVRELVL